MYKSLGQFPLIFGEKAALGNSNIKGRNNCTSKGVNKVAEGTDVLRIKWCS